MKRDCTKEEAKRLNKLCGGWGRPRLSMGDPGFAQRLRRDVEKFSTLEPLENEISLFERLDELRARVQGLLN